ncbi:neuroblast differentiation-associated protein AHNAK isoform X1 [Cetorhinus maximus]
MNFSFDQSAAVVLPGNVGALSDGLTLTDAADGGIIIENIQQNSPVAKAGTLKKGDQLNAVTIHFDNLNSKEVSKILKYSEPYKTSLKLNEKEELKSPDFRYNSPDMGSGDQAYLKLYNSKIKPHLKLTKPDLSVDGPGMDVNGKNKMPSFNVKGISSPDIDMNLKATKDVVLKLPTNIDLAAPKIQAEVKGPSLDIDTPRLNGAKVDGKMKPPGTFSISGVKPKVPEMDVSAPESKTDVKVPDIDIGGVNVPETKANLKMPKLEMPSFGLSGPNGPDVDVDGSVKGKVKLPKADISAPEIKTGIGMDLKKPTIGADFDMPDMNLEVPDVKLKGSRIKMPSLNMSGKNVSIPHVDANLPSGNIDLAAPKIYADVKSPNLEINAPNVDDFGAEGKFKIPKFKKPTFSISGNKPKKPELDASVPDLKTDIKAPNVDIGVPEAKSKWKMPKLEMPSFGLSGPKGPDVDVDGSLKAPGVDVSVPNIKGNYETPNVDIKLPKGDIDANIPDAELKEGKFKLPGFNLPGGKLSMSGTDKGLKMPKGQVELSAPDFQGDIRGPSLDMKGPSIDVNAPSVDVPEAKGKWKMPKLEMPSFGLSGPKGPDVDVDGSLKAPGVDVSAPNVKGNYEAPNVDIKLPKGDIDANIPDAELKGGKFKLPGFNLPGGKLSMSGTDKGLKMPKGQVELSAPDFQGDIRGPSLDLKGPNIDVNAPSLDVPEAKGKWKMPKLEMPSFGLSGPKGPDVDIDGSLKAPAVDVSAPNVKGNYEAPNVDIKLPKGDIDANIPDAELKGGKFKLPGFNLPGGKLSMSGTDKGLKMPKGQVELSAPDFQGDIRAPSLDLKVPNIDVNAPSLDVPEAKGKWKMPKLEMPSFGLSGPKGPDVDVDGSLKAPGVNVSAPNVKGNIHVPNVDLNLPKGDIDANIPDAELKGGKFKLPGFNLPSGKLSMSGTDKGLKMPKGQVELSAPDFQGDIRGPSLDLKGPSIDVNAPSLDVPEAKGKWKMPKLEMPSFGLSGPKGPDVDVDGSLKAPAVNVSAPNVKGNYEAPNVDIKLPKGDIDANIPDAELKGGKFKLPGFNLPGGTLSMSGTDKGLKMPKSQVELSAPDLQGDIRGPSLDLKGPSIDVNAPSLDVPEAKGKWKMPKLEMPSFGLSGPKGPDVDVDGSLKAPGVDVSAPNVKGNIHVPNVDLNLPKGDIDANIPDAELKGGKFKLPGFNLPSGKLSMSGTDKGLKMPKGQVELSAPDFQGDIRGPSLDMKGPSIDVNAPSVDVPEAKGKWKMPKLEMPSFGLSGPKGPDVDVDGSLKAPGVNVSAPNIKGNIHMPNVDLNLPKGEIDANIPDAELSKRKFTMPKFNLPSANLSDPEMNLNLKAPTMTSDVDAKLKVPKLKKPNLEISRLEGPNVSLDGKVKLPKADISAPEMKTGIGFAGVDLKKPTISADYDMPDMNLEVPDVKLKGSGIKMPSFNMSGKNVSIPHVDANLPSGNIDLAAPKIDADVKSPNLEINAPKVDDFSVEGKFKFPKFKKPTFSISGNKPKKPELDASVPDLKTDIKAPNVDIGVPEAKSKWKMPKLEMPSFGLSGPKGPDVDVDGSLKAPGVDVSAPNVKGNFEAPNVDIKLPKGDIDVNIPDAELKGGKFKLPGFNLPGGKLSMSGTDKGLKMPKGQVELSAPDFQGDIRGPSLDLKGPSIDVNAPSLDVPEAKGKWKMPKLEMPSFGLSGPKGPDVDVDGSLKAPAVDVSAPNVKGNIHMPNVDLNLPKGDIDANIPDAELKGGKFKLPGFNLPSGKLSMSGTDKRLKMPKGQVELSAPDFQGDIRGPSLDMKGPNIDVNAPSVDVPEAKGKWKMPKFEMPSFGLSGPKGPDVDVDGSLKAPGVDVSAPNVKGNYEAPNVHIKLPKGDIDANIPDAELKGGKFKLPGFNLPGGKLSMSGTDKGLKMPKGQVELSAPDFQGDIRGPSLDMKGPSIDVNAPSLGVPEAKGKWKMPKLEMPSFGLSGPKGPDVDVDGSLKAPAVDVSAPNVKGNIQVPNVDLNLPKGDIDANIPDAELKGGKFKLPGFNLPSGKLSMSGTDKRLKMPKGQVELSAPDFQGDIRGPSLDMKGPNIDVNAPSLDVPEAKGKWKMPKFEMPFFGLSGPKGPDVDVDGSLKAPGVDVSAPNVKGNYEAPNVHIKLPKGDIDANIPDAELKGGKFKLPGFNLPGGKLSMSGTDKGLKMPKGQVELSAPDFQGDIRGPSLDMKGPSIDVNAPSLDVPEAKGKWKMPKLEMPSFGLSGPKGPDVDVDGSLKAPAVDVSAPNVKGNIHMPNVDLNLPKGDIDANIPDAELKGGEFKLPGFNLPSGKLSMSGTDKRLKMPKGQVELSAPDFQGDIRGPSLDMKGPNIDVNAPSVDVPEAKGKWKMPKFEMPSFGLSGSKGPDVDVDGSLKAPGVDVSAPNVKGNIQVPNVDLNLPKGDIDANIPDAELKGGKFKLPGFNLPSGKLSMSGTDKRLKMPKGQVELSAPDLQGDIRGPSLDMKGPNIDVNAPSVDVPEAKGKWKMPKLEMPSFGLSGPKGPDVDVDGSLKAPGVDVSAPNVKGNIAVPNVDLHLPKGDIVANIPDAELNKQKLKIPKFTKPKLEMSGIEGSNMHFDGNVKIPKADVSAPEVKTAIGYAGVDLKNPTIGADFDMPDMNLEVPDAKVKGPSLKKPSLNMPSGNVSIPDVNINLPTHSIRGDAGIHMPGVGAQQRKLKNPNMDMKGAKVDVNLPNLHGDFREIGVDVSTPNLYAEVNDPKLNIGSDENINMQNKCSRETFKIRSSLSDVDDVSTLPESDPNLKARTSSTLHVADASMSKKSKFKFPKFFNFSHKSKGSVDFTKAKAASSSGTFTSKLPLPELEFSVSKN